MIGPLSVPRPFAGVEMVDSLMPQWDKTGDPLPTPCTPPHPLAVPLHGPMGLRSFAAPSGATPGRHSAGPSRAPALTPRSSWRRGQLGDHAGGPAHGRRVRGL